LRRFLEVFLETVNDSFDLLGYPHPPR